LLSLREGPTLACPRSGSGRTRKPIKKAGVSSPGPLRSAAFQAASGLQSNSPIGILFLELNGARFTASEPSAAQAILSLAAGALDDPALTAWLRANAKHP